MSTKRNRYQPVYLLFRLGHSVLFCCAGRSKEGLCRRGFGDGYQDEEVGPGGVLARRQGQERVLEGQGRSHSM